MKLVKVPWHGVFATPASLIRATNDVMLDISLSHIPAACETITFVTHIVTAGGHRNFPEEKCLVPHRVLGLFLGTFLVGKSHRITLFPAEIDEEFPPQHWHCLVVWVVWHRILYCLLAHLYFPLKSVRH